MTHDETLGQYVKRVRSAIPLSINKAAKAGGISNTSWQKIEGDKLDLDRVRPETLVSIAKGLGRPPSEVFEKAGRTYEAPEPITGSQTDVLRRLSEVEDTLRALEDEVRRRRPPDSSQGHVSKRGGSPRAGRS